MFNNVTYNSPLTPSLLTELSMGNDSTDPVVYGPQSFILQFNEVSSECCSFFNGWEGSI
jgi:iron transport multicopper oxidase